MFVEWTQEEKTNLPSKYGCELIYHDASDIQIKDTSLPNDTYIVVYTINGTTYTDMCRGNRSRIFDLYYDKFGPGTIKKIDFGYGRSNPRLWGEKNKVSKNKKR